MYKENEYGNLELEVLFLYIKKNNINRRFL